MAPAQPLTEADARLINAAAASYCDPLRTRDERTEDMKAIARILPRASRDHVRMSDLAAACDAMLDAWPPEKQEGGGALWTRARFDLGVALAEVFRWRNAELEARLQKTEGVR